MAKIFPTLYIPHGAGPCFFMEWSPADTWKKMEAWFRQLGSSLGAIPKAIIVVSAHWEEKEFSVTSQPAPKLFFDYYGFPEHTYQLQYPAPGAPELAKQVLGLLSKAGITGKSDAERDFDHGVFIPFKLIYPNADIPIIQLSLKKGLDPATHIAAGRAIAGLREQGVLIVGSGMSYHNLRGFGDKFGAISDEFDAWLTEAACVGDSKTRNQKLTEWHTAPSARLAHPREEHLLPLMVVAGAAEEAPGKRIFIDRMMGVTVSAYQFGA